jgi:hypothetical protein
MKLFRYTILFQAAYTLITAVWPLIHIKSFMEVTGYKTDIWLVKTVGALLIPVSLCLLLLLFTRTDRRPAFVLGGLTAMAFACIDFYYASTDVISNIYMADGAIQLMLILVWSYLAFQYKNWKHQESVSI